jgi:hypothetical protein
MSRQSRRRITVKTLVIWGAWALLVLIVLTVCGLLV